MKKPHIKYIIILLVGVTAFVIYLFNDTKEDVLDIVASDETEDRIEDVSKNKTSITVPKSTLPMNIKLLPNANSEIRVEPTTHIVLHFSSSALTKPHDPYQVDDVYNVFKE